jgi:nitroimidazol reductase NimA-like FMN-containing flavoprotein (pyridoxamine 5'-phosphate oxidase superfamily)
VSDDPGDLARACLAEHYVLALGTCGPEGPWVASVYFAADLTGDRLHLYFLSSPSSRHSQNLRERAFYLDNRRGFGERTDVTRLL